MSRNDSDSQTQSQGGPACLAPLLSYVPVCAIINLSILPFTESFAPIFALAHIGPLILLFQCRTCTLFELAKGAC